MWAVRPSAALKQRLGRQQRQRELAEGAWWSQSSQRFQPTLYRKWISALGRCVCSLASSPNTSATKSVSAMLIPDVSVPLRITRFQVPVPWNTLQLLADNVVPYQLPAYQYSPTAKAIFSSTAIFQKNHLPPTPNKKTSKTISFKLLVSMHPKRCSRGTSPPPQCLPLTQCDGTTILQLSQYCTFQIYSIGTMITEKGQFSLISTWVSPPTQAHSRPTHRWPCNDFEHMYAHPDVRAQTGCLQQAHLLPMGSAAFTVLLTIQVFSSAALFVECLL